MRGIIIGGVDSAAALPRTFGLHSHLGAAGVDRRLRGGLCSGSRRSQQKLRQSSAETPPKIILMKTPAQFWWSFHRS